MDTMRAAELLIEKIKKDYTDDVALVVMMGSAIYGETHSRSDLDLYFIPKTERGFRLCFTFIIDGIGFDFWAIPWERLERIGNFDEAITSIITEGKILYCASEADQARFDEIKKRALDTNDQNRFIEKAGDVFDEVYKIYFRLLSSENLTDARTYALGVIRTVTFALALLNRTAVKRGRGKLKKEILAMPLVPEHFEELYDTVFLSSDLNAIKNAYGRLIQNTETLLDNEREKLKQSRCFADTLKGFYEEMINFYNKIHHAYEIDDKVTALFASVELSWEIEQFFNGTGVSPKNLPDLVGAFDPGNLQPLLRQAQSHQKQLVEMLTANGVDIREFRNFEGLETYLHTL